MVICALPTASTADTGSGRCKRDAEKEKSLALPLKNQAEKELASLGL